MPLAKTATNTAHAKHAELATNASAASTPRNLLVVVLGTEVRDELVALGVAERVLQLHQLDEQVVLGVQALGRSHRRLPVEAQPLLDAVHAGAVREIHEQRQIENDRRREDRVAAQEVDLDLHRI